MEKDYLSIKRIAKYLRNYRLNFWACVPIAISSCPDTVHMYKRTF